MRRKFKGGQSFKIPDEFNAFPAGIETFSDQKGWQFIIFTQFQKYLNSCNELFKDINWNMNLLSAYSHACGVELTVWDRLKKTSKLRQKYYKEVRITTKEISRYHKQRDIDSALEARKRLQQWGKELSTYMYDLKPATVSTLVSPYTVQPGKDNTYERK